MIPAGFEYVKAKTLGQALTAAATKDTQVLAGGQSLIPLLRFRLAQPKRLVDIGGLAQLKGIKATPKGLRIGSGVTYRELLDSTLVRKHAAHRGGDQGHRRPAGTESRDDRRIRRARRSASDMPAVLSRSGDDHRALQAREPGAFLSRASSRRQHRAQEGRLLIEMWCRRFPGARPPRT
jgi:transposase